MLTNTDLIELTAFRRELHRFPEVSRCEEQTAGRILQALRGLMPDQIETQLGGHGIAAVFNGAEPGPTLMFRAELDALPITEISDAPHRSTIPGKGHLCGHDGHMVMLLGLGRLLMRNRPARGRVVLLFQPAEEDGSGAAAVLADPRYAGLHPDWAFAIHNMPGAPFGQVWLTDGTVNCASLGLRLILQGKTAHASQPEKGTSPARALSRLMPGLAALGQGGAITADYRLVTVTHARLGDPAFGIAPGEAELWVTLRSLTDAHMADLCRAALGLAQSEADCHGLSLTHETHDAFAAATNHPMATAQIAQALNTLKIRHRPGDLPMRASEDFGRFASPTTQAAMLFLGTGESHPALHNPDYDFPDDLIPIGTNIFNQLRRDLLG